MGGKGSGRFGSEERGPRRYKTEYVDQLADELIEYAKNDELPFLKKFAADRLIPSQKFSDDKAFQENEKFQIALGIAKDLIEHKVWSLGCAETINPTMAIFTLKNLGWRDHREVEHSGAINIKDLVSDVEDRQKKNRITMVNQN